MRILFLLFLLFAILINSSHIRENLIAINPRGVCVTKDGKFSLYKQVLQNDGTSSYQCLPTTPSDSKKQPNGKVPQSGPCFPGTPYPHRKIGRVACFSGRTVPTNGIPSKPFPDTQPDRDTELLGERPRTTCHNLRMSDFDSACIQQFGPGYGYQSIDNQENTCPLGYAKAFCSRAYKSGQPLYEEHSTDCYPYHWTEYDSSIMDKRCRQYYGPGYRLGDIRATGCPAPNYARGVCTRGI